MKKISTAAAKATKSFSQQKLMIGLDLGDRSSWYCMLDESGVGKKRAIIATARKLAVWLHHLWVSGEVYEPVHNSYQRAMPVAA